MAILCVLVISLFVHHANGLVQESRRCYGPIQPGEGGSRLLSEELVWQENFGLALLLVQLYF